METGLGLTYTKDENFGEWYSEVVIFQSSVFVPHLLMEMHDA